MDDYGYRQLHAWKKAMDVVDEVYVVTRSFPVDERFGLISQMRRCAVSIPSNIAEGYGRGHRKEYLRHLGIARASIMELETQVMIAVRQQFLQRDAAKPMWSMIQEAARLLNGLIRALEKPTTPASSSPVPDPRSPIPAKP